MANPFNNQKKVLWWAIFLYFIIFSGICVWKYFQFGYNGLDLAIFNQVFYNSVHGHLFNFTIHPQSYLGDHFELLIIMLLPFYYLFQHPISLLILQSFVLALAAWPLYLIAEKLLPSPWPLILAVSWLLNPFVQNINLFEFHILPFAIIFIFWAFYFYQQNKFLAFLLSGFLALLVREDVALVVFMFAFLALLDKKKLGWIAWPALLGAAWFILAIKVTAHFAPDSQYKFLYYYSWLGNNFKDIIINSLAHPLAVVKHILTWNNALFTLGIMLPFAYLLKIRYLLLGLLIYLQIILGGAGNSAIALKLHYSALLLPALFISFIYFLRNLLQPDNPVKNRLIKFLIHEKPLTLIIISTTIIYAGLTLGPIPAVISRLIKPIQGQELNKIKAEYLKAIPSKNSLAATYEFLTALSSRPKIYSLHYAFIGKLQFSDTDYQLPPDLDALVIDFSDFITYGLQFPNIKSWQEYYQNGDDNIKKLIASNDFKVAKVIDSLVLMEKNNDLGIELYERQPEFNNIEHPAELLLEDKIKFLGWASNYRLPVTDCQLPITLYFQAIKKLDINYQLKLIYKNENGETVYEKYYPLAYGLYPTTEWQTDEVIKINHWFQIPQEINSQNYGMEIQLVDLKGFITLDGIRSVVQKITQETALGQPIELKE